MTASPNPIQIQKFLGGIDYPASKNDIVTNAEDAGADDAVLDALRGIDDTTYSDPTEVSKQLSK
ncbi:MAG TPA: DUF2795 domain-containing protein [Glaciihabitans sp.]|jgi:hypothetical protein|nr:DUF2795 domain-containing protein [Glaciihabitans sp.]